MVLPDGQQLPASPENRRRAAELWQLDNSGRPERVEDELREDDERVERAEREIQEMRRNFEREREERRREDDDRERAEHVRNKDEHATERQRTTERENEVLRFEMIQMENDRLKSDAQRDRQVQMLREELEDEREKTRLRQKDTVDTRTETATTTQDWTDAVRYSLQMDDPAVDVVTDFSNCVILEPKLRSIDSVGNPRVGTTTEFFYVTNEKSKDLKLILSQPTAGSSLESRLMKYWVAFHSQNTQAN